MGSAGPWLAKSMLGDSSLSLRPLLLVEPPTWIRLVPDLLIGVLASRLGRELVLTKRLMRFLAGGERFACLSWLGMIAGERAFMGRSLRTEADPVARILEFASFLPSYTSGKAICLIDLNFFAFLGPVLPLLEQQPTCREAPFEGRTL